MASNVSGPARYQLSSAVETLCGEIDSRKNVLHHVSREIHSHPELLYNEVFAHDFLSSLLEQNGYAVERQYKDISTAFKAEIVSVDFDASKHSTCVICCEYDALPEIGHACGHNLIAESSVGAFLGLAAAVKAGLIPGRVIIMGTPAEEGGGGKIKLIKAGAFKDVDFSLMAHGGPIDVVYSNILGSAYIKATFTGKAAHAAAGPWEGINALDACVAAYNSLAMIRQQTQPSNRIHAVVLEGGIKPNIIPERAVMEIGFRSPIPSELRGLAERCTRIVQYAAESHGCQIEIQETGLPYSPMLHNHILGDIYEKYETQFGSVFEQNERVKSALSYSTDMGDVSLLVPSIHPTFRPCKAATGLTLHTTKFCEVAGTDAAQQGTIRVAKSMACTVAEVLSNKAVMDAMKAEFTRAKNKA